MNEEQEHSRQDAQAFIAEAESYLLLTLNEEDAKVAGYASDMDQLVMLIQYLSANPSLKRSLRIYLTYSTGEN
ncbi:hypothetical protein [uncultured Mediterranean phage uvDeep-CGR2-KM23-C246]|nr:hypothetical protein [uncultured Mediterranean phage uvDeep-CGR2-KM23-C246]